MEIICIGQLISQMGKHSVQSASAENQELNMFILNFWPHHHFVLKFLKKQQHTNKILKIYQHYHQCFISAK